MTRWKRVFLMAALVFVVPMLAMAVAAYRTEADISGFHHRVEQIGHAHPLRLQGKSALGTLPEPVRRYFGFVFGPEAVESGEYPALSLAKMEMAGQFRRPLTDQFAGTTASQTLAMGKPALMFDADTPVGPGLWARAYDFYAGGEMEMMAKVVSVFPVVDEKESPALNLLSLRRWLLESPLFPAALLPGGPVRWEAMDQNRARAVVTSDGLQASMIAEFDMDGRLISFRAETDGDLSTPYHGSGEHVSRSDYRPVSGMMIPHEFVISRAAAGEIHPFWKGRIMTIAFD